MGSRCLYLINSAHKRNEIERHRNKKLSRFKQQAVTIYLVVIKHQNMLSPTSKSSYHLFMIFTIKMVMIFDVCMLFDVPCFATSHNNGHFGLLRYTVPPMLPCIAAAWRCFINEKRISYSIINFIYALFMQMTQRFSIEPQCHIET